MFKTSIAQQFAAETDPGVIAEMLADFALVAIQQFGPEYLALREMASINTTRKN